MRLTFHGTLLGIILLLLAMMATGPARQLWAEHQQIRSDEATLAGGNAEATRLTASRAASSGRHSTTASTSAIMSRRAAGSLRCCGAMLRSSIAGIRRFR